MIYIFYDDRTFADPALVLGQYLASVNIPVNVTNTVYEEDIGILSPNIYIMFGLHMYQGKLPYKFIAYQLEQSCSSWITPGYISMLNQSVCIWDYSYCNMSTLISDHGILPSMIDVVPMLPNDVNKSIVCEDPQPVVDYLTIPVLFMGAMNDRRTGIVKTISDEVKTVCNAWGDERDVLVDRSNIVLNIHYYNHARLETTRLVYLLSRGAFIISEHSEDPALDRMFNDQVVWVDHPSQFSSTINHYINRPEDIIDYVYNRPRMDKYKLTDGMLDMLITYQPVSESPVCFSAPKPKTTIASEVFVPVASKILHDKSIQLKLININPGDLPRVAIITPTSLDRFLVLQFAMYNFARFKYPKCKLEWIIVDDSPTMDLKGKLKDSRIKYVWCGEQKRTIGYKRNVGVAHVSDHVNIIANMDDDDLYFPESINTKVRLLTKYQPSGVQCIGCFDYGVYHMIDNYSFVMNSQLISEASMVFTKQFWAERQFPEEPHSLGEGYLFLKGRETQVRSMPYMFNFIAITHTKNVTHELRSIPKDRRSKDNLFKLFDRATKMFILRVKHDISTQDQCL